MFKSHYISFGKRFLFCPSHRGLAKFQGFELLLQIPAISAAYIDYKTDSKIENHGASFATVQDSIAFILLFVLSRVLKIKKSANHCFPKS